MDEAPAQPDSESSRRGFEVSDARPRGLMTFTAALVLLVAACFAASAWFYKTAYRDQAPSRLDELGSFKGAPDRTSSIKAVREQIALENREHLETYGWVDREAGIVRVPIEQAMEAVLKDGFPTRKEGGR